LSNKTTKNLGLIETTPVKAILIKGDGDKEKVVALPILDQMGIKFMKFLSGKVDKRRTSIGDKIIFNVN